MTKIKLKTLNRVLRLFNLLLIVKIENGSYGNKHVTLELATPDEFKSRLTIENDNNG